MKPPRGLSDEEASAWAQVASTVRPLAPRKVVRADIASVVARATVPAAIPASPKRAPKPAPPAPSRVAPVHDAGLDGGWDRKLSRGTLAPDFTLDLHGHTLDQAHGRLIDGIAQARAMGARVVLLITGKPRPVEAADRGVKRGAIRAKVLDWLAASSHGTAIASIRKAHIRHGGDGALYVVLKRSR